jgi:hypothetical protein
MITHPILIEVSPGELADRVTILRIKSQRMTQPNQLERVRRELASLAVTWAAICHECRQIEELELELERVNRSLWDIEDSVRTCEAMADFGPQFIELARAVYKNNDHRAALKRQINQILASERTEEKCYASWGNSPAATPVLK